eukprot:9082741-Karenia_brevis.AAC.1
MSIKAIGNSSLKNINQSSEVGVSGHKRGDGSGVGGGRYFGCYNGSHRRMITKALHMHGMSRQK